MKPIPVASFFFAVLLLAACSREARHPVEPETLPPATVAVESVRSFIGARELGVPGQVRPAHAAVVSSRIQAQVNRIDVVPGQAVERGDILAVLDSRALEARAERVGAELEAAEREWERVRDLMDSNAATPRELEGVEARYRSARASLDEAQIVLGYATVRAPISGVITRKYVDPGDLLSPGNPIVDLHSPDRFRLESWVPESLARDLTTGDRLAFEIEASGVSGTGAVSEIDPDVDPGARSVLVKVDLPPESGAKSGQYARIFVSGGEARRLWVSEASVVRRGQLEQVFVVEGDPPSARLRLIRTGVRRNGEIEVVAGLHRGESVVAEVPSDLRDGQTVEIAE